MEIVDAKNTKWTKELIRQKIISDQVWLERGILAIYERQTAEERKSRKTLVKNGVGFSAPDAKLFSYLVWWLKKGNHLSGEWKRKAWKRFPKYAGQLEKIANGEV